MPIDGSRLLRGRAPTGMEIAAGEYGYDSGYFRRVLEAGAVDVLQADATRCVGVTGSAPSLHAHFCWAALSARTVEYFQDHVRIEAMSFEGAAKARNGMIQSDLLRHGSALEVKHKDVEKYRVYGNAVAQRIAHGD